MRISSSEEYGLRLAIRLAEATSQLSVRELAELEHLPEPTVAKVLGRLRRAGVVRAERGRNGGFVLAAPAEHIDLSTITRALDRPLYDASYCQQPVHASHTQPCAHLERCTLRPVWRGMARLVNDFLSSITLADVATGATARDMAASRWTTPFRLSTDEAPSAAPSRTDGHKPLDTNTNL